MVPLGRRHALEFLHPALGGARALGIARQFVRHEFAQSREMASDHSHHIPQQAGISRMMDIRLHHGGIAAQRISVFESLLNSCPDKVFIEGSN